MTSPAGRPACCGSSMFSSTACVSGAIQSPRLYSSSRSFAQPRNDEASNHAERVQVGLQNSLLLLALVDVLLAQPHHDPQRLHVKTIALGFRIDVADVVGERLLLFFKPLDPLDKGLELVLGKAVGGLLVFGGGSGGHRVLLA